ncbi:MAG: hypothetical protein NT015_02605, partial [Alphaproteobacteria bacterium]|nr:hypothetical protein [Alphaproteobacteria bacterium]
VGHGDHHLVQSDGGDVHDAVGHHGLEMRQGAAGGARIYTRSADATAYRVAFDAAPPVAPGLTKPPAFAF